MVVAGYTISIIVATFLVNNKGGAQRTFAVIAPIIGAAMFAAGVEYLLMCYGTLSLGGHAPKIDIPIEQRPSVFDFLYMIAFPFHSRSVGYFAYTHGNVNAGGRHYEV